MSKKSLTSLGADGLQLRMLASLCVHVHSLALLGIAAGGLLQASSSPHSAAACSPPRHRCRRSWPSRRRSTTSPAQAAHA